MSDGQCQLLSPLGNKENPNPIELLEKIVCTSQTAKRMMDDNEQLLAGLVSSTFNGSFAALCRDDPLSPIAFFYVFD